ncbi:hypothetical protein ACRAWG_32200 [Methylobacterium sp. P31]
MIIRIAAALTLASVPAAAQTRLSSTAMTCQQTIQLIRSRGAIVLGTGGMTYDRFVSDRSFCEPTEIAKRAFRPTRDNPKCLIGYTCYEPSPDDWPGEGF